MQRHEDERDRLERAAWIQHVPRFNKILLILTVRKGFLLHIWISTELVSVKVHAWLVFHRCVLMYFLYLYFWSPELIPCDCAIAASLLVLLELNVRLNQVSTFKNQFKDTLKLKQHKQCCLLLRGCLLQTQTTSVYKLENAGFTLCDMNGNNQIERTDLDLTHHMVLMISVLKCVNSVPLKGLSRISPG